MAFRDITQDQLDGFAAGRLSLDDLANAAGISKQAASQALKRRGIRRGASDASPAPPAPSAPQNAPSGFPAAPLTLSYAEQIEALAQHARITAGNAALGVLIETEKLTRGQTSHLGASALKAAAAAVAGSLDVLARLGFLSDETESLEAFDINVMSEEEERILQDSHDIDDSHDAADAEAEDAEPDDIDDAQHGSLTPADLDALRKRLDFIVGAQGVAGLRTIAVQIGAPVARTAEALIGNILDHVQHHGVTTAQIMESGR